MEKDHPPKLRGAGGRRSDDADSIGTVPATLAPLDRATETYQARP